MRSTWPSAPMLRILSHRSSLLAPRASLLCARAVPCRTINLRGLCTTTPPKKPEDGKEGDGAAEEQPVPPSDAAPLVVSSVEQTSGGVALQEEMGENLPPLEFEPGVAGAAQKGVSAVVIAFGAAAFAGIAWGAYMALFPSATSTQCVPFHFFRGIACFLSLSLSSSCSRSLALECY